MKNILFGLTLAVICLTWTMGLARQAYVSDMLILTFRESPDQNANVLQTLKSNTPLTILGEENGYYKVALESGDQGWVDKQFVVFDMPKARVIETLQQEKAALTSRLEALTQDLAEARARMAQAHSSATDGTDAMKDQIQSLKSQGSDLEARLQQSRQELADLKEASKEVLEIMEKNKGLTAENLKLSSTIDEMEKETAHLFRTGMIKWFLAGVGVLLLGWIIGQSVSSKRRQSGSLLD